MHLAAEPQRESIGTTNTTPARACTWDFYVV